MILTKITTNYKEVPFHSNARNLCYATNKLFAKTFQQQRPKCHIQICYRSKYIGKAEVQFSIRLNNHRKDARKSDPIPHR